MPVHPSVERIGKAESALQLVLTVARDGAQTTFTLPLTADGERRVLRWGSYMPGAALGAADTMDLASSAFTGMPLTADQLRSLTERVRVGEVIMMHLDNTYREVSRSHQADKDLLCGATTLVTDTIRANLDNPCTPKDLRAALESQGRPVLNLIARYNQSVQDTKHQLQRLRDEGQAALAEAHATAAAATATKDVLRGQDLTPQALPASRRGIGR